MSLGRLLRTVRYLSAEQIFFSIVRRARHAAWRLSPQTPPSKITTAAARLSPPNPQNPVLRPMAGRVALLQRAVHPEPVADLRAGRLRIFGQSFTSDLHNPDWRGDKGEGNSPLRRLTLAYFGWAVPLLAEGRPDDLGAVAHAVASLDAVPWSEPDIFRDLWNPYTASHRLINLLCALNLYGQAGSLGDADLPALLDHVRRCAALVAADPERDLQANHLLKDWTALAVYAAATPEPAAAFPSLASALRRSLDQLVLDDGGHAERSPMYHALGLLDIELLRASGAVPTLAARLDDAERRMRHALGLLTHPDGDIALFNDAWLGGAPPAKDIGLDKPSPGRHVLPDTGYIRLDGGADVAIFDAGPCGLDHQPGHAHADYLSIELSVGRERFIVDLGTATYTAGELRDRTRSAASHNGPHITGHEPVEFWQSFRVGRRATAGQLDSPNLAAIAPLWCAGWHDGYHALGVEVRRWIGLWPGQALLLIDAWPRADVALCRSRFLVPQRWKVHKSDSVIQFQGPSEIDTTTLTGTLVSEPSEWWPRYGEAAPATALEVRPAVLGGLPICALLIRWGAMPEALSLQAVEQLAQQLIAAR